MESSRGQLVFELPHARTDGATHLLLDPLELLEKLTPTPRRDPRGAEDARHTATGRAP